MGTKASTHKKMAYLIKKKVKGHTYWQTVESYRDPETGKTKKRVLKHHGKTKPQTVEWYTPSEFVEMARQVLGSIDLDPASKKVAQKWIKADNYFTKDDDGLAQPWHGNIWCNPPYGNYPKKFLKKGLSEYHSGNVSGIVFLLNRSGAEWYLDIKPQFSAICEVRKRIAFFDAKGIQQESPRYNNDFLYLGNNSEKFCNIFSSVGDARLL